MSLKVLIIGNGAREHALAHSCHQSGHEVFCLPGNPGTASIARNIDAGGDNASAVKAARDLAADLVIVGPEAPLAAGLADELRAAGLPTFGPNKAAAEIESDKAWSKAFMARHNIPTAAFASFDEKEPALAHAAASKLPLVVKDAGLRAGKGVTIAFSANEAADAIEAIFTQDGAAVVLEEFMSGQEVSVLAVSDGKNFLLLPPSQDHKTIGEGDTGPMTGGMGVICPFPISNEDLERVGREIVGPALRGLAEEGREFCGVLYAGLMLTAEGPKVVEFNARFGDPETEAVLPLLEGDLAALLLSAARGELQPELVRPSGQASAVVILAAAGYPGTPEKGAEIKLPALPEGGLIFQAGTTQQDGKLLASGGRVLAVVGLGDDLDAALKVAYELANEARFAGAQLRRDIGFRLKPQA